MIFCFKPEASDGFRGGSVAQHRFLSLKPAFQQTHVTEPNFCFAPDKRRVATGSVFGVRTAAGRLERQRVAGTGGTRVPGGPPHARPLRPHRVDAEGGRGAAGRLLGPRLCACAPVRHPGLSPLQGRSATRPVPGSWRAPLPPPQPRLVSSECGVSRRADARVAAWFPPPRAALSLLESENLWLCA